MSQVYFSPNKGKPCVGRGPWSATDALSPLRDDAMTLNRDDNGVDTSGVPEATLIDLRYDDGGMGEIDRFDAWQRRMRRAAERLRLLDERRFERQIARIEECLRRDAAWDLRAALASCDRWSVSAADRLTSAGMNGASVVV